MQNNCDFDEFRNSTYYYAMYDFDATTGFHLQGRLTEYDKKYLNMIATHVLDCYKRDKRERRSSK